MSRQQLSRPALPGGIVASVLLMLAVLATAPASLAADGSADSKPYIVVLKNSVDRPGVVAHDQAAEVDGDVSRVYHFALNGYAATLPPEEVETLEADPRVRYVARDRVRKVSAQTTPTGIKRIFASSNASLDIDEVNDVQIDADIAIIDTGIDYAHPDLSVAGRTNCVPVSESSHDASVEVCTDNQGTDPHGHGTHVAGTAAAIDNGIGVVGSAPGARLWAVRVLNSKGQGSDSWIIAGIDWVTAHASQIEVANMSLGGPGANTALDEAIENSVDAGVVYTVAAGNSGIDAQYEYPANHPDVITVSALADYDGTAGGNGSPTCGNYGDDDELASFSNFGDDVEIAAPGVCIYSTRPNGAYGLSSGTSMAAPHVAGAAAYLASEANPDTQSDVEEIEKALIDGGSLDWTDGSPDAHVEPLLFLDDAPLTVTEVVAKHATTSSSGATLHGSFNARGLEATYKFEYGRSSAYGKSTATEVVGSGAGYHAFSETLEGLPESTSYHYRLVVTSSAGTFQSQDRVFTTREAAPTYVSNFEVPGQEIVGKFAVSADGYVYAIAGYPARILKMTTDGDFVSEFGSQGKGNGEFETPSDIEVDQDGYVYVADTNNYRVQKFSPSGTYITHFSAPGDGPTDLFYPTEMAIAPSGDIYVIADWDHVQKFDSSGQPVAEFGSLGEEDGEFLFPSDIDIDAAGKVYVSDWQGTNIQVFNASGDFLSRFGSFGNRVEDDQFEGIPQMAVDAGGDVYIPGGLWAVNYSVRKFGADGDFLSLFGSPGFGDGEFSASPLISIDPDGNLWLADGARIQKWLPRVPVVDSDVDHDGHADLVAIDSSGTPGVFQGAAAGIDAGSAKTSLSGQVGSALLDGIGHYAVDVADVTGEGRSDLVTMGSAGVSVHPGQADRSFGTALVTSGVGVPLMNGAGVQEPIAAAEVDGDIHADYIRFSQATGALVVVPGKADGYFDTTKATLSLNGTLNTALLDQSGHYFVDAGDVNGDSYADVVSMNTNGTAYVFRSNGDRTFSAPVSAASVNPVMDDGSGQEPVGVGDVNGDGRADLLTLDGTTLKLWAGKEDGTFATATTAFAGSIDSSLMDGSGVELVGLLDYSRDGLADLVVAKEGDILSYRAQPGGTFASPSTSEGNLKTVRGLEFGGSELVAEKPMLRRQGCAVTGCRWWSLPAVDSDVTGDGKADLATLRHDGVAYVHPGNGEAKFGTGKASFASTPLDPAQFDGEGQYVTDVTDVESFTGTRRSDLITLGDDGRVTVYTGEADGSFKSAGVSTLGLTPGLLRPGGAEPIAVADVNGGGRADLVAYDDAAAQVKVYLGQTDNTFGPSPIVARSGAYSALHTDSGHHFVDAADVTGDNRADLVSIGSNGDLNVFPGQPDGTFATPVVSHKGEINPAMDDGSGYEPIGLGDVTGDRYADLALVKSGTVYLYPGSSAGSFGTAVTSFAGTGPSTTFGSGAVEYIGLLDVNGDKYADIAGVLSSNSKARVVLGQASGSFVTPATSEGTFASTQHLKNQSSSGNQLLSEKPSWRRAGCSAERCPAYADKPLFAFSSAGNPCNPCNDAGFEGLISAENSSHESLGGCDVEFGIRVEYLGELEATNVETSSCTYGMATAVACELPWQGQLRLTHDGQIKVNLATCLKGAFSGPVHHDLSYVTDGQESGAGTGIEGWEQISQPDHYYPFGIDGSEFEDHSGADSVRLSEDE